jgi:YVTN family beta-propeller protein
MAKAGGALWIQVDPPVDAIVRIDVATGLATPAVPLGHKARSGSEGLWVVGGDWLARVEPTTSKELLRVPMGGAFALADGAVWLLSELGLHRIDASTGKVGDPVGPSISSVCESPKDLVVAFDSAWLACKEGKVVRIDPSSGDATDIPTDAGAHTFTVVGGAVWVTNYRSNTVSRIDPETNKVTTIAGAGHGVGITSGGGYVWAATPSGIAKIDPDSATIVREIELGSGEYYELVWDDGIIWASTRGSRVLKVDPSKATP